MKKVSIVISIFNEELNLVTLFKELEKVELTLKSKNKGVELEYICVNDGSTDDSLNVLKQLRKKYRNIIIYNLYRNFGHEIAMTAGMDIATGDAVIFMDADLQHPPKLILNMIELWLKGNKIVLTKRKNTHKEGGYRILSAGYYWLINKISDVPIYKDFPDFRLLDKKYIDLLKKIGESDRMFRGLLNYIGISDYVVIEFEVPKRFAGRSKYNLKRSFKLAMDSIIQFSTKPLRLGIYLGFISIFITTMLGFFTLIQYLFFNYKRTGYATTLLLIIFMNSIILIVLGIIGEYISKIHIETKKRPLYFGEIIDD